MLHDARMSMTNLPIWRRLAWRLGASFLLLTAIAVLLSGFLQYRAQEQWLRQSLGSLLLNIGRTGALLVDGDLHQAVVAAARSDTPDYARLRRELVRIQETNRLGDAVYTLTDVQGATARFAVISNGRAPVGLEYRLAPEIQPILRRVLTEGVGLHRHLRELVGHLDHGLRPGQELSRPDRRRAGRGLPGRRLPRRARRRPQAVLPALAGRSRARAHRRRSAGAADHAARRSALGTSPQHRRGALLNPCAHRRSRRDRHAGQRASPHGGAAQRVSPQHDGGSGPRPGGAGRGDRIASTARGRVGARLRAPGAIPDPARGVGARRSPARHR